MDLEILENDNLIPRLLDFKMCIVKFIFRINHLMFSMGIFDFSELSIGYKNYIFYKVNLLKLI